MMRIVYTDEQRAECEAHWAAVRSGLHVSHPHEFHESPRERVAFLRYRAGLNIHAAVRDMQEVLTLCEVTQ